MKTIKEWPKGERPRERLLSNGAQGLSDAELLAIILRTGRRGQNALDMARAALAQEGGLQGIIEADAHAFQRIYGLSHSAFTLLQAGLELSRRYLAIQLHHKDTLANPKMTKDYIASRLQHEKRELFCCLYLDVKHRLLAFETLFYGTINQARVYPREVIKQALSYHANGVILAHNHPSGCAEPSQSDQAITKKIQQSLEAVDVTLLDHLIVGQGSVVSLADRGWID